MTQVPVSCFPHLPTWHDFVLFMVHRHENRVVLHLGFELPPAPWHNGEHRSLAALAPCF